MSDGIDEIFESSRPEPAKGRGGWPKPIGFDANLVAIQQYLTEAAALPIGYAITAAERLGQYGTDPMTVTIRRPGDAADIVIRFRNQRDVTKPVALVSAFIEATNGASSMRPPKGPEAVEFYRVICRLATVVNDSTVADETQAWVAEYVQHGDRMSGTLRADGRYDALAAIQGRAEFDRPKAQAYIRQDLPPGQRWTLFIDEALRRRWIRVGEFATYVRHVIGVGRMGQHTLDALMKEIGFGRERFEVNPNRAGRRHIALSLYSVTPTDQSIHRV